MPNLGFFRALADTLRSAFAGVVQRLGIVTTKSGERCLGGLTGKTGEGTDQGFSLVRAVGIPARLIDFPPYHDPGPVAKHSHYNEPVVVGPKWAGRSRDWGDASLELKLHVVSTILDAFDDVKHQALALAMIYVESGFNPDAAAKSTSAAGPGQFIDRTAEAYGIEKYERFSIGRQLYAIKQHFADCLRRAEKKAGSLTFAEIAPWVYAFWHDGPSLKYGGYEIAMKRVMPKYYEWLEWLNESNS